MIRLSEQESFESGFEKREGVQSTEIRREGVPEVGSRATKCPVPHCDKTGRGNGELEGVGGS